MSMELKFRAWDKRHKDMEYIDDLYWFEEQGIHDADGNGLCAKYDIMPFSGIHDKNGKEIYLGDIVVTQEYTDRPYSKKAKRKRHTGIVEYVVHGGDGFYNPETGKWDKHKEYAAGWQVKVKNYGKFGCRVWGDFYDCEVVGNIYENPELLEQIGENK